MELTMQDFAKMMQAAKKKARMADKEAKKSMKKKKGNPHGGNKGSYGG
tara:strand:- start:1528 stop:1671 length:144 start_codon:yes stop_codon:yes gene_type:complete